MMVRVAIPILVAIAALVATSPGSASRRAGSASPWFGSSLVGWTGSYSFSPTGANSNDTVGDHCQLVGAGSVTSFPLSLAASASPTGWTISVGDQGDVATTAMFGTRIDWPSADQVGDIQQVVDFQTMLQAVPPSSETAAAGRRWYLQFFALDSLQRSQPCPPPALLTEQSPIGPAFPMLWTLGDGASAGGVGCGYVAIQGGRPPTTFASRFLLTDSLSQGQAASLNSLADIQCVGGKAVLPSTGHASPSPTTKPAPANSVCRVPRVLGATLSHARRLVTDAGCRLGAVTHAHSQTVKLGLVMAQTPPPARKGVRGTRVSVVLSLGPK